MSWSPNVDVPRELAALSGARDPGALNVATPALTSIHAVTSPAAADFEGATATAARAQIARMTTEVTNINQDSDRLRALMCEIRAATRAYNDHYNDLTRQLQAAATAAATTDPYNTAAAGDAQQKVSALKQQIAQDRADFVTYLRKYSTINGAARSTLPAGTQTRYRTNGQLRVVNNNGTISLVSADGTSSQLTRADGTPLISIGPDGQIHGPNNTPLATSPEARRILTAALTQMGNRYSWGGGHGAQPGPTLGTTDEGGDADQYGDRAITGVDCSGLARLAAANAGVDLGDGNTNGQLTSPALTTPRAQVWTGAPATGDPASLGAQPGDLLYYGTGTGDTHHVAIYVGNGVILEAPQSGSDVSLNLATTHPDLVAIRRAAQ